MHTPALLAALCAAGTLAALVPATALAQHAHRGDHRHGGYGGHRYHGGPSWHYRGGPRFYHPAPVYVVPPYVAGYHGYPLYAPAPPYIERYYVEEPPPPPPPPPRQIYRERSYAQIEPPRPAAPAAPATPRLERFTLAATELFEFDKAVLRKPQPKLDEIAAVLQRNPQIGKVRITGYTDRLGSEAYNLKLSQRRADAVKGYFIGKGVAAERLAAVGRGEADPVVQCRDRNQAALIKCLEPNRRVVVEEITVEIRR